MPPPATGLNRVGRVGCFGPEGFDWKPEKFFAVPMKQQKSVFRIAEMCRYFNMEESK